MVVVTFETDKYGYIINNDVVRSSKSDELDNVALKMIKSISKFSVHYRFGAHVNIGWSFPIRFKSILNYCN